MSDAEKGVEAPDVDLSLPIYPVAPESLLGPSLSVLEFDDDDDEDSDDGLISGNLDARLTVIEEQLKALMEGVNTIGAMMNGVADAFDQMMQQVNKGGLGALLGGLMGKNNG